MSAQIDCIDAEFTLAASPEQKFQIGEDFYPYVGMNYILVPNNVGDVDIAYTIQTDVGTIERSISKVPVQKNYRTNLMGNLLTDETVIKIVVVDGFDGDELINY